MAVDRRGCFYLVMVGVILLVILLMGGAFHMLAHLQQQQKERTSQPRWLRTPERQR